MCLCSFLKNVKLSQEYNKSPKLSYFILFQGCLFQDTQDVQHKIPGDGVKDDDAKTDMQRQGADSDNTFIPRSVSSANVSKETQVITSSSPMSLSEQVVCSRHEQHVASYNYCWHTSPFCIGNLKVKFDRRLVTNLNIVSFTQVFFLNYFILAFNCQYNQERERVNRIIKS